jgi:hypothetical protein
MTLLASIRATLAAVASSATGLGESWSYRTLTSDPDVTPRTYSVFASVDAVCRLSHVERYDEHRRQHVREEQGALLITDAIAMKQGDQVKSPAGNIYTVRGVLSQANNAGTVLLDIGRTVPLIGGADRGQGV